MMESPQEILTENAQTYDEKNDDYGDSWRLVGETLSLWCRHAGADELVFPTDSETLNSLGLFTRRLDKIIRAFNGEFLADELNFESIRDSHADESTYAAMHASLLAEQESIEFYKEDTECVEELLTGGGPVPVSVGFQAQPETEEDYDEALPIEPEYQAKYDELMGDD
jgi:hypothetical protein